MNPKTGFFLVLSCLFAFSACAPTESVMKDSQNSTLPPELIGMWKYTGIKVFQGQTITNRGFPFPPQVSVGTCISKIGGVLDVHPDGTYSFREELVKNCPPNMKKPISSHGKGILRQSPDGSWQLLRHLHQALIPIAKIEILTGSHCPILRISSMDSASEELAFQTKKEHFSDEDLIKMASFSAP